MVVIASFVLILYFTLGSKGNKTDQNNPNGNNKNEGKNTNTPGKNKDGDETKQDTGTGSKILRKSLTTVTGIAGGTGITYAANRISDNSKQNSKGEEDKNNQKNDGPYTYVDSTGEIITKSEGKDSSDNIKNADTDVSNTEHAETPNGAERIEKTKAEGKGVSDNVENADSDVQDTEQLEILNEAEKEETDEEMESKD